MEKSKGLIKAQGLGLKYSHSWVFRNVEFAILPGEFVSLLGTSGSGKSSLLRILSGLESPTEGQCLSEPGVRRSIVFQSAALLPWLSLEENVRLPARISQEHSASSLSLDEVLEMCQLNRAAKLFPHQLSGGMAMRAALARALITKPDLLFLDEPFSALDELTRESLQDDLLHLWNLQKMSVIFVTHSIAEAIKLSQKSLVLLGEKGILEFKKENHFGENVQSNNYVTHIRTLLRGQRQ